jgi:repressor of nif and glnA expression
MGIVCDTKEAANYLMDASDRILTQLHEGTYEFDNLEDQDLKGILTLENVIERILNMDIHDEKDYDRKMRQ